MAWSKMSLKVTLRTPVATRIMTRAARSSRSFKPFLIIAPTSRPMMNGRTSGTSQAISGGTDR